MAERSTYDITNDLRLAAVDRERTRGPVRGLMREAADKLDALLEDLVIAEKARDRARDVADERSRLLETARREADTWWRRSEKQVDVIADLIAERDQARGLADTHKTTAESMTLSLKRRVEEARDLRAAYELKVADLAKETERVEILARVLLDDNHSPEGFHAQGDRCRHCAALRKALRPEEGTDRGSV